MLQGPSTSARASSSSLPTPAFGAKDYTPEHICVCCILYTYIYIYRERESYYIYIYIERERYRERYTHILLSERRVGQASIPRAM